MILEASRGIRHVDVLKIDVEGAEEEILTSTGSLPLIDWITGELHVDVINQTKSDPYAFQRDQWMLKPRLLIWPFLRLKINALWL